MKKTAALLAAAAVSAAGIAYAAITAPTESSAAIQYKTPTAFPNADTVFGGGHFTFFNDHNFSVTATNGSGTLVYSVDAVVAQITCLNVSGKVAVVAGTIVSTADGSNVGTPIEMYFEDNGQPHGTTVGGDVVSPLELLDSAPKTCPAANISNAPVLDALDAGDITVHAKGS
jgi:hypothetical protein